jgi:hypothetical protein
MRINGLSGGASSTIFGATKTFVPRFALKDAVLILG